MRRIWIFCLLFLSAAPAAAQVPPFFGGGVVAYDPTVSVIQSGALLDAQATVSADKKYVTLNMRATNARLRDLVQVPVSQPIPPGFVGGINLPGGQVAAAPAGPGGGAAFAPASPDAISRQANAWILTRQGMYLVTPLK